MKTVHNDPTPTYVYPFAILIFPGAGCFSCIPDDITLKDKFYHLLRQYLHLQYYIYNYSMLSSVLHHEKLYEVTLGKSPAKSDKRTNKTT